MERQKPFVAYMQDTAAADALALGWARILGTRPHDEEDMVPVVVTPLLENDLRPGDECIWTRAGGSGVVVTICGGPFEADHNAGCYAVDCRGVVEIAGAKWLTRKPALKMFRLVFPDGDTRLGDVRERTVWFHIEAESREEAVRKLAAKLEEVV